MLERIKDYLYDISDILISLVLVAVIAISITYKITDAFTIKIFNPIDEEVLSVTEQFPEPETDDPVIVEPTDPSTTEPVTEEPIDVKPAEKVKFEITRGMTGYNIANVLLDSHLIDDVNTFIQRVEEMGLGSKLRSGTFNVSSNIPMDELIKVISGQ
jgi:hypothetical protein